jgi:chemotaxis protein CheD
MPSAIETPVEIVVGVADCQVCGRQNGIITTYALGSCLGITAYDPINRVGGMLHAMLPTIKSHQHRETKRAMFVDSGMSELVAQLQKLGISGRGLEFKVFGGARVLQADEFFNIGAKNIQMMRDIATQYNLRVRTWEVAGNLNRTIKLNLSDGRVRLRMPNQPEAWL